MPDSTIHFQRMCLPNLLEMLASNQPIVAIDDHALERFSTIQAIDEQVVKPLKLRVRDLQLIVWSPGTGQFSLPTLTQGGDYGFQPTEGFKHTTNFHQVLDLIDQHQGNALFILLDSHAYLSGPFLDLSVIWRLRDLYFGLQAAKREDGAKLYKYCVLLGQDVTIPADLSGLVEFLSVPLPDAPRRLTVLREAIDDIRPAAEQGGRTLTINLTPTTWQQLERVTGGMSETRLRNLVRRASYRFREGETAVVIDERLVPFLHGQKMADLARCEVEFLQAPKLKVGGAENVIDWLQRLQPLFDNPPQPAPLPKGMALVGPPGTGKTLIAETCCDILKVPGVRLDVGTLMQGEVGRSEATLRQLLKLVEAMAPCILFIDELDKAGLSPDSARSDGGVASRLLGTLLTWTSSKTVPVFLIVAMNRFGSGVPSEFLRKGRFNEIFWVDLPNVTDRLSILNIHLDRYAMKLSQADRRKVAQQTTDFSGADLMAVVEEAWLLAYSEKETPTLMHLQQAIATTVPVGKQMGEEIRAMRQLLPYARNASATAEVAPSNGKVAQKVLL